MNTNEILESINRKYETIKEESTKEIDKQIEEAYKEKIKTARLIGKDLASKYKQMLEDNELGVIDEDNLISINYTQILSPRMEELDDKKQKIKKDIEKEKNKLINEIILFGINNEMVKEKINSLFK